VEADDNPDRPSELRIIAYAAAAWSLLFAAMSFYWAAGGMTGLETLGNKIDRLARERDSGFVTEVWVTGFLKLGAGLLALALVQPWGRRLPRRILVIATWVVGIGLTVYGVANLVQHGLMEAGVVETPSGLGSEAATWHLLLWDPWWLLGGLLFVAAARHGRRDP
jgi:Protein of unknown function (DUF3995)